MVEDSQPNVASEESDVLEQIRRHLLPTLAVSPPKATPIPSDRGLLIQHLLGPVHPVQPVVQERSRLTDIKILLQSMLPVGSVTEAGVDGWVFSCGELDHETEWCPVLDESCPRGGGQIGRTMNLYYDRPRGGLPVSKRETSTDPGRGDGRPDQ